MAARTPSFCYRILAFMHEYDLICFDMDGTLLPLEVRDFLIPYYQLLEAGSRRAGFDSALVRDAINDGIFGMYDHPADETNAEAFWRVFLDGVFGSEPERGQVERMVRFLDEFYERDFGQAGQGVVPNPAARRAVQALHDKDYPLYLMTMPMFPYAAIEWRMKWADAPIELFDRVTTYDNSTAVKPSLVYYRENLALADVDPARVLMVGNNTVDDLACLQCGMDAYLITDYLINMNGFDVDSVKHGTLAEFAEWAEALPACTSTHALSWRERADVLRAGGCGLPGVG